MKSPVRLYLRVRLPDGSYPYVAAVYASNGRLRPHTAVHQGKSLHCPASTYYLRYQQDGRRVWEPVGTDPALATVSLQKKAHQLQATALGLAQPTPLAPQPSDPFPTPAVGLKRLYADAVATYIAETTEHKSTKTLAAYRYTLKSFGELIGRQYVEDITREDILAWIVALRKKRNAPRTIRNRVDFFQIFLHSLKIPSLLVGRDLPQFTQKKVRAYNPEQLNKMFRHGTQEETDLLHFLLCTGAREQEAQFVCWSDVDLERKTYTVTEHLDLGYRPKDKEEGTLPIPDLLVDVLRVRRTRHPRTRLIFPGKQGGPNGHALRIVKQLALRSGANCGLCVNKAGKSCANHPVCSHVILHKMRKTFASTLHHNGLPAQTLQRYLRHSDLSTTIAYIADQPDDQVRETINATFTGFCG